MSDTQFEKLLNQKGNEGELYKIICNSEALYKTISDSISYGIIQIAEDSVKSEYVMKKIGGRIEKIVKIYKNPNLISEEAREPIPELEVFWHNISFIAKHKFNELEEILLFRDSGYPIELINQISRKSNKKFNEKSQTYKKTELYKTSIGSATKDIEHLLNS